MVTAMVHDGTTRVKAARAFILLLVARGLEFAGILWAVYFAGNALLAIAFIQRFSDVVADAFPLALAGGLGITFAWWMALLTRRLRVYWHRRRTAPGRMVGRVRRDGPEAVVPTVEPGRTNSSADRMLGRHRGRIR